MKNKLLLLAMGIVLSAQALMAQVPSYVSTNGLIGYWPFNGNANNEGVTGNNGTVSGATLTTDRFGNANSAYNFNGINSKINFSNSQSLINLTNFTYSVWINRSSNCPNEGVIISNYGGNQAGNILFGKIGGSGDAQIRIHKSNADTYADSGVNDNQWINLVAVKDTNFLKMYKNGILIQTTDISNFASVNNISSPFVVGSAGWTNINYYFSGKIDDLGVWNRALTQQEITNLYNNNLSSEEFTIEKNNITIFPNPASSQININFNNITNLNGGTLKIINSLGQEVATTPITTSGTQSTMQLATWGGTGMYFVQIINPQGQIVDIKKIILQ